MANVNMDPSFQILQLLDETNIQPFSIHELNVALQNKSISATGMDDLAYIMFKKLPYRAKQMLLDSYNNMLLGDSIPTAWKKFNIICLPKANKDHTLAENYRPIVLASCRCKTLEIMIKNRLDWFLEHHHAFGKEQLGFRKGKGIYDNVAYLSTFVFNAFILSESVLAVFLDIKSAYDNVNIYKLYNKMNKLNIPVELNNLIHKILRNRLLYTRGDDGNFLGPVLATRGIPQGSPLSTILFNIYLADLFKLKLRDAKIIGYADDLVLIAKGTDINTMVANISLGLNKINQFLTKNDLSLALNKCEAVWFTKGGRKACPPPITINNEIIEYKTAVKYLGIFLHKHLKWNLHVDNIVNKARKNLNILKAVCRVWWGADPATLLMIFQALIISHLDFGSILLKPVNQNSLNKMNVVFYEGLRVCLGCMRTTPRAALLAEASLLDLEQRRKNVTINFLKKIVSIQNHPIITIILESRRFLLNRVGAINENKVTYLIAMSQYFLPYLNNIYKTTNLPCYEINFEILISPIKTIDLCLKKHELMIKEKFYTATEKFKNTFTFIYTDASKKDNKVGYGVTIPNLNYKFYIISNTTTIGRLLARYLSRFSIRFTCTNPILVVWGTY